MAVHKISIDDFDLNDYELIAIHSRLDDYRMAFFLNQALNTRFSKPDKTDIEIGVQGKLSSFSRYIFEDTKSDVFWNLVSNKTYYSTENSATSSLFNEINTSFSTPVYLLPEFKTVDFILKIENIDYSFDIDNLIEKINSLNIITTAYAIDQNKIKSKDHLIF